MNVLLSTLLLVVGYATAQAQTNHPTGADPGRALYREANTAAASLRTRAAIKQHENEFLNKGTYETGYLRTLDGRRILVLGLRYHVGQRVLQVQDSMQVDSTYYWPLAAVRGFDLGTDDAPLMAGQGAALPAVRRYRSRLVQENKQTARHEAVEIVTSIESGPLLLAWLPMVTEAAGVGITSMLVAGPGTSSTEPLRPLELTEAAVLHLCASRAKEMRTFADSHHLHFDQPLEVAKILDYYNRVAIAN